MKIWITFGGPVIAWVCAQAAEAAVRNKLKVNNSRMLFFTVCSLLWLKVKTGGRISV
jgi:hypothetical protein